MKKIKHPHDLLFKKSFSDLNLVKEFFAIHLPKAVLSMIDLERIELKDKTFIHPTLRKQEADVLFSVPFLDFPEQLYLLLEHLSNPLQSLPLRTLEQQIFIMKNNKHSKYFPIVRVVVYYTGDSPHLQNRHLRQLFNPKLESLLNNMIAPSLNLIQVKHIPDKITRAKKYTALMELAFKLPYRDNIQESMPLLTELIYRAEQLGQINLIVATVHYLLDTIDMDHDLFIQTIFKSLQPETEGELMTIAQRLKNEGFTKGMEEGMTIAQRFKNEGFTKGMEEGLEKGMEEGLEKGKKVGKQEVLKTVAEKLLQQQYPIQKIIEITALSEKQILQLQPKNLAKFITAE